jgi:ribosomal-protein-alanine N-acetyltransferase
MTFADVAAVADLEAEVFPHPWTEGIFCTELARANRRYLVAEDPPGEIAGYGGLMLVDRDAHITTLAVRDDARGRGLGTRIMLELADAALAAGTEHLTLEVRLSNLGARRLYRRFGFAPVGLRRNYYRDEDALIMWAIDIDRPQYLQRLADIRERIS